MMFLEHLKRQILKRRYAQGWCFARSTSPTAYFFFLFLKKIQAWVCSNFVKKKRSDRDGAGCGRHGGSTVVTVRIACLA
jgi:hypothetical protein